MIKVDKNSIEIDFQGDVPGFVTEVTMFLRVTRKCLSEKVGQEITDNLLEQAVRLSKMDAKELEKEATSCAAELFARIFFGAQR